MNIHNRVTEMGAMFCAPVWKWFQFNVLTFSSLINLTLATIVEGFFKICISVRSYICIVKYAFTILAIRSRFCVIACYWLTVISLISIAEKMIVFLIHLIFFMLSLSVEWIYEINLVHFIHQDILECSFCRCCFRDL